MKWTDSDNLRGREALVVGGPYDGMRVTVNDSAKGLRYPDVVDLTGYVFDREAWQFVAKPKREAEDTARMLADLAAARKAAGVCRHCGGPVPCWSPYGDVRVGVRHPRTRTRRA